MFVGVSVLVCVGLLLSRKREFRMVVAEKAVVVKDKNNVRIPLALEMKLGMVRAEHGPVVAEMAVGIGV